MTRLDPIYTAENCRFAYQLRWGVSIFWREAVAETSWLTELTDLLEQKDHIRILSWRWLNESSTQFAVSTCPSASPLFIIQRIKGRLQYAVRQTVPKALRPHYAIRSYGTQQRQLIEDYIAKQPIKHPMASDRSQQLFDELLYVDQGVDLSVAQTTTHGRWWHNLHVVLVHVERWRDVERGRLTATREVILANAKKRGWRVSRCAILVDHLHVSLGCQLADTPESVVLSMMNNVAWVYGMKPELCYSAYLGTIGEYDQRAVSGSRPETG